MQLLTILFSSFLVVTCYAAVTDQDLLSKWAQFKSKYNKMYSKENGQEEFRFKLWRKNLDFIQAHNKRFEAGEVTFSVAQNHMSDLTKEERKAFMGYANFTANLGSNVPVVDTIDLPESLKLPSKVDWRDQGAVNPIKNQGSCGSCWSFAAVATMEAQHFLKHGKLLTFSEQQLVDCVPHTSCDRGGNVMWAYMYLTKNRLQLGKDYKYVDHEQQCGYDASKGVSNRLLSYYNVPVGSELALQQVVAVKGPVAISMDASSDEFNFYHGGVLNVPNCGTTVYDLSHAMTLIGYDTTPEGVDYYIVRNSWGTDWGEKGYVRMSRNKRNQCGIATEGVFPILGNF